MEYVNLAWMLVFKKWKYFMANWEILNIDWIVDNTNELLLFS